MRRFRLLLPLLLVMGCAPPGPLAADAATATRQVEKLVPRGSTERRARELLTQRGFTLSRLASDHATNHLLVATCIRPERMWQVGLVIVDAHVAGTSVTITELGKPER